MTKQIDADTLRHWLETNTPVTVLDMRTDEDRAAWAIPASIHINAYDARKRGGAGAAGRQLLMTGRRGAEAQRPSIVLADGETSSCV
jgi:hypothetical protein